MILFEKDYDGFEAASDIGRDISEMWNVFDLPGEFQGTMRITVEYFDEKPEFKVDNSVRYLKAANIVIMTTI